MTELVVQVVWSEGPRSVRSLEVRMPLGATVGDVLMAEVLLQRLLESGYEPLSPESRGCTPAFEGCVSIWGRSVAPAEVLRNGDRLELCRPLRVDPKTARRERFRSQGARSAGLFKSRRPGAKAGY
jgi:RnfH family Ubiquitin